MFGSDMVKCVFLESRHLQQHWEGEMLLSGILGYRSCSGFLALSLTPIHWSSLTSTATHSCILPSGTRFSRLHMRHPAVLHSHVSPWHYHATAPPYLILNAVPHFLTCYSPYKLYCLLVIVKAQTFSHPVLHCRLSRLLNFHLALLFVGRTLCGAAAHSCALWQQAVSGAEKVLRNSITGWQCFHFQDLLFNWSNRLCSKAQAQPSSSPGLQFAPKAVFCHYSWNAWRKQRADILNADFPYESLTHYSLKFSAASAECAGVQHSQESVLFSKCYFCKNLLETNTRLPVALW